MKRAVALLAEYARTGMLCIGNDEAELLRRYARTMGEWGGDKRMSYEIITYSPDTGTDEHGNYKTQGEARQGLKLYRQEPAALIYDLDRWRIVYRRGYWPAGALPIERWCNA